MSQSNYHRTSESDSYNWNDERFKGKFQKRINDWLDMNSDRFHQDCSTFINDQTFELINVETSPANSSSINQDLLVKLTDKSKPHAHIKPNRLKFYSNPPRHSIYNAKIIEIVDDGSYKNKFEKMKDNKFSGSMSSKETIMTNKLINNWCSAFFQIIFLLISLVFLSISLYALYCFFNNLKNFINFQYEFTNDVESNITITARNNVTDDRV